MNVSEGGKADQDGFSSGDLIQFVNGTQVKTVEQLIEYLRHASAREDLVIRIVRTQWLVTLTLRGGAEPPHIEPLE